MKNVRICSFALLTHLLLTSCSSDYVPSTGICNVSGHLHIAEGKAYITPMGYNSDRDAIAEFEIKDGVFKGSFEGDPNMAYKLFATADGASFYYCPSSQKRKYHSSMTIRQVPLYQLLQRDT